MWRLGGSPPEPPPPGESPPALRRAPLPRCYARPSRPVTLCYPELPEVCCSDSVGQGILPVRSRTFLITADSASNPATSFCCCAESSASRRSQPWSRNSAACLFCSGGQKRRQITPGFDFRSASFDFRLLRVSQSTEPLARLWRHRARTTG